MAKNAKCPVCGKMYEVCLSCSKNKMQSWKTVTDTEECFKVFTTLHRVYVTEKMTKEEAREKIADIKFEDLDSYPLAHQIKGILEVGETNKSVKVETEKVVEPEVKVEEVTEPIKEFKTEEVTVETSEDVKAEEIKSEITEKIETKEEIKVEPTQKKSRKKSNTGFTK